MKILNQNELNVVYFTFYEMSNTLFNFIDFAIKIQHKDTKEEKIILVTQDLSTYNEVYNKFFIELVEDIADEDLFEAKVKLPNGQCNYYAYQYQFINVDEVQLLNLVERGTMYIKSDEEETDVTFDKQNNTIIF